ncbi:sodium:solute symporter family transporter [Francisella sp. SYW-2]|uniref:sodium:solute symporter family transporter n=1 Tax=Francisella sp. SYW-2 TaxID=2610886 RepID=UPI00123D2283|nr:sodium:solute symporter [Francisella sp. SYW-2]
MNNSENYYTAGKSLGLFALTATLVMTELNISTLIGFSSLGYLYGFSALSLGIVFLVGLLFYSFSVAKKWKNFDAISVSEFFSQRYNPVFGLVVALCLLTAMAGFGANFIYSTTIYLQEIFPSYNHWSISGVACSLMLLFTIRDGLLMIVKIDKLSFLLSIVLFIYLGYSAYNADASALGYINNAQIPTLPVSFSISLAILTAFTYILSPWYGQKIFAAKSKKVAFYAVLITSFIVSLIYLIAVYTTAKYAGVISSTNPDKAFVYIVRNLFSKPMLVIFYLMMFMIALTTIAALWNTMASMCSVHFQDNKSEHKNIITVMIIAILNYILANTLIDQVLDKMLLFNIPIAALAFSLLYGFYGSKTNLLGAILSTVIGVISALCCYLIFNQDDFVFYWASVCIPLSFIIGYLPVVLGYFKKL